MKTYRNYLLIAIGTLGGSILITGTLSAVDLRWGEQSSVGQSFTGISALLSAFALLGILQANTLQRQQNLDSQGQIAREMQFKLLELSMNDEDLADLFNPSPTSTHLSQKQSSYLTMVFRYYEYGFVSGHVTLERLRAALVLETFPSPLALQYWSKVRGTWAMSARTKKEKEFVALVTEFSREDSPDRTPQHGHP